MFFHLSLYGAHVRSINAHIQNKEWVKNVRKALVHFGLTHCLLVGVFELYRVFFLFLVLFNLTSRSYFRSDFVDRPINLFTLLCAIEWGIDHNSIITLCRVTSQYVKAVFFVKNDFSKIELKFPIFKIFLLH